MEMPRIIICGKSISGHLAGTIAWRHRKICMNKYSSPVYPNFFCSFDGMDREGETASGASFGVGALPNCFHPFINLEETYTEVDWVGLHRSRDPGAGAFTPYHNRKTYAYDEIEAG